MVRKNRTAALAYESHKISLPLESGWHVLGDAGWISVSLCLTSVPQAGTAIKCSSDGWEYLYSFDSTASGEQQNLQTGTRRLLRWFGSEPVGGLSDEKIDRTLVDEETDLERCMESQKPIQVSLPVGETVVATVSIEAEFQKLCGELEAKADVGSGPIEAEFQKLCGELEAEADVGSAPIEAEFQAFRAGLEAEADVGSGPIRKEALGGSLQERIGSYRKRAAHTGDKLRYRFPDWSMHTPQRVPLAEARLKSCQSADATSIEAPTRTAGVPLAKSKLKQKQPADSTSTEAPACTEGEHVAQGEGRAPTGLRGSIAKFIGGKSGLKQGMLKEPTSVRGSIAKIIGGQPGVRGSIAKCIGVQSGTAEVRESKDAEHSAAEAEIWARIRKHAEETGANQNQATQTAAAAILASGSNVPTSDSLVEAKKEKKRPPETKEEKEARLPKPFEVPQFDECCYGTPLQWNETKPLIWGRRVKNLFWTDEKSTLEESLLRIQRFLSVRCDADGLSVFDKLGPPLHDGTGWFRYEWMPFAATGGKSSLPRTSPGEHNGGASDWKCAWHGCKLEALYSIMYHGRLFASCDAQRGERFFGKAPGVYVHKDETCVKTGNYFRFVPLCRDGVFWAPLWEVMVDRADRVPVSKTDQWVQKDRSVRLVALWLVGCTFEFMQNGWEVASWDPLLEAHPRSAPQRHESASRLAEQWKAAFAEMPEESGATPRCHLHLQRNKKCRFCKAHAEAGNHSKDATEQHKHPLTEEARSRSRSRSTMSRSRATAEGSPGELCDAWGSQGAGFEYSAERFGGYRDPCVLPLHAVSLETTELETLRLSGSQMESSSHENSRTEETMECGDASAQSQGGWLLGSVM